MFTSISSHPHICICAWFKGRHINILTDLTSEEEISYQYILKSLTISTGLNQTKFNSLLKLLRTVNRKATATSRWLYFLTGFYILIEKQATWKRSLAKLSRHSNPIRMFERYLMLAGIDCLINNAEFSFASLGQPHIFIAFCIVRYEQFNLGALF